MFKKFWHKALVGIAGINPEVREYYIQQYGEKEGQRMYNEYILDLYNLQSLRQ